MNTEFSTKTGSSTIPDLPVISKYFGNDTMQKGSQMINRWRKGEKPIGAVVALLLIALAAWGLVGWVLPMLFAAIGKFVAVVAPIGLGLLLAMSWKGIYRLFRSIARAIHKRAIRWKPFDEFADQIQKMRNNYESFLNFKAVIKKLRYNFDETAQSERKEAEKAKEDFDKNKLQADRVKKQMDELLVKDPGAKDTDDYTELEQKLMNATSAATRANQTLQKSIEWSTKYAARSNVFAKLDRKLAIGATRMDNMIQDFEKQVELWKKDFEGAESARITTGIMKKMLGKQRGWELEYTIEYITDRIAQDYAQTAQNIEELNKITTDFDFNSDDAYAQLDAIAEKIKSDSNPIPDVNKISNVGHKLTSEEKKAAGPLGDIF